MTKEKAVKLLEKISHDYIRARDSVTIGGSFQGYCVDCGKWAEGQYFQAGHFLPSGSSGAVLRYHPQNMHGQRAGCNMKHQQEQVKINYTFAMIKKYGKKRVEELRKLKQKSIKADITFYEMMIDLYRKGDEVAIIHYLEKIVK